MWRNEGCAEFSPLLVHPRIGCYRRLKRTGPIFALCQTRAERDVRTSGQFV